MSGTETGTPTGTGTPVPSPSFTPTFTFTFSGTPTRTMSITPTSTVSPSITVTPTVTMTVTITATFTVTPTATIPPAGVTLELEAEEITVNPGGDIIFSLVIRNTGNTAYDLVLWDSVPANMSFPADNAKNAAWTSDGAVFSYAAGSIAAGGSRQLQFVLRADEGLEPGFVIIVGGFTCSYTDEAGPGAVKYAFSNQAVISVGDVIAYPNPFNPDVAVGGFMKFGNVPKEAVVIIYTISGETVVSLAAEKPYVYWNGRNSSNSKVSPGVYYYTVKSKERALLKKGIIYVVKK
jgi:uncharacterized repeat protein (TIGR01451 family)